MWAARWIEITTRYCEFPEEERGNGMDLEGRWRAGTKERTVTINHLL